MYTINIKSSFKCDFQKTTNKKPKVTKNIMIAQLSTAINRIKLNFSI